METGRQGLSAAAERPSRSTFSSSWGTVLSTAGVAIGLGNIWRFPYMMGQYGGAVFLVVYLLIIVAFGIPALMAEWSLGRHTRRGTWAAFQRAGMPGGRWFSLLLLFTVGMAASYYGVVLAWVLYFAVAFAAGGDAGVLTTDFNTLSDTVPIQLVFVLVTVALGCACLFFGVKRGIERVSKLALPVFFLMFAALIVRVLMLDGAITGLKTFLVPRWEEFTGATALAALGQAFFSLALGGTFMVAYGSYMRREEDIPKTAVFTAAADVSAALMAGLIVVPAAIALGVSMQSGPSLMFEVMPEVFRRMPAGGLWGAVFFGSIFLVALLSLMAGYEVVVAACEDGLGWRRPRVLVALFIVQVLLSLPALIYGRYIELSDLVWGTTMQPVGAAIAIVAMTWCVSRATVLEEIRRNASLPVPQWLFYWIKYVIPLSIAAMLIYGWVDWLGRSG